MFVIRLALLWIGAQYSLVGVGLAHLAAALIEAVLRYFVAAHFLKITIREIVKELTAFLCGAALAAAALPALYLTANIAPFGQLLIVAALGAAAYLGALWLIERQAILNAAQMLGLRQTES
jgi:hypothetical protein